MTQCAGVAGCKGHGRGNVAPRTQKGREEMLEGPEMQKWNKEKRPEIAGISRKQKGIQQDCQEDFQTGDHEVSSLDFQLVVKNK
jgi:hypothetical protein